MIEHRPYQNLGKADYGWLKARYHFSFARYFDPERMGWGKLRVLNDDLIAPHSGFGEHSHRNMEIITFLRKGAITHKDNAVHHGRIATGGLQVMSAGSGISHSEYNFEATETALFQLWIETSEKNLRPSWQDKHLPDHALDRQFFPLASGFDGDRGALKIHAEARISAIRLKKGQSASYSFAPGRLGYVVLSEGKVSLSDLLLEKGDGAAIKEEKIVSVKALDESELLLIETAS